MGAEEPDITFYRDATLHGGLAYRDDDLQRLFGWMPRRTAEDGRAGGDLADLRGELPLGRAQQAW